MVTITAASGVDKAKVEAFPAFQRWKANLEKSLKLQKDEESHKFHSDPYELETIELKAAMIFTKTAGFVFLNAVIKNKAGRKLDGGVFLRGDSVVIMVVVEPEDAPGEKNRHVLVAVQPRVPAGSLAFAEFPAGMVDDTSLTFAGTAKEEIKEETGLVIKESELIKMSDIAFKEIKDKKKDTGPRAWQSLGAKPKTTFDGEKLADAFYMSPGGTDESIKAYYVLKQLPRDKFDELNGKETGNQSENEQITLKLVPLADVWYECQRDAKSLAALALYQNLKAKGLLK